MKKEILDILREHNGAFVSGEELSRTLNVSRTAIWKHIRNLRNAGYMIESVPHLGYRLIKVPDLLLSQEIQNGLHTRVIGQTLMHFMELGSTNEYAKQLARNGAAEGTVVIAEAQTDGRGRLGRTWVSPPLGGVWLSLILRPPIPISDAPKLTLMVAVAVARTINRTTGFQARIKWPNDVYLEGKKVCGILAEMSADMDTLNFVVLGIGINVNVPLETFPQEIRETATSLYAVVGKELDRVGFVRALLEEIENAYHTFLEHGFAPIRTAWREFSFILGSYVTVQTFDRTIEGKALDLDNDGALLIEQAGGEVIRVMAGDLTHLRPQKSEN